MKKLHAVLGILLKYESDSEIIMDAYKLMTGSTPPGEMSADDRQALDDLGFFWDSTFECWNGFLS